MSFVTVFLVRYEHSTVKFLNLKQNKRTFILKDLSQTLTTKKKSSLNAKFSKKKIDLFILFHMKFHNNCNNHRKTFLF